VSLAPLLLGGRAVHCVRPNLGAFVDWDGDLDILTGQDHGGSGLHCYERDYVEDML
jgi:hypothetical protein